VRGTNTSGTPSPVMMKKRRHLVPRQTHPAGVEGDGDRGRVEGQSRGEVPLAGEPTRGLALGGPSGIPVGGLTPPNRMRRTTAVQIQHPPRRRSLLDTRALSDEIPGVPPLTSSGLSSRLVTSKVGVQALTLQVVGLLGTQEQDGSRLEVSLGAIALRVDPLLVVVRGPTVIREVLQVVIPIGMTTRISTLMTHRLPRRNLLLTTLESQTRALEGTRASMSTSGGRNSWTVWKTNGGS
jgi:hypothetical protein